MTIRTRYQDWFYVLLFVLAMIFLIMVIGTPAHSETWKKDTFGYETWRSDKGGVVKKDRYGPPTWRSNRGEVCKYQQFGGGVKCTR